MSNVSVQSFVSVANWSTKMIQSVYFLFFRDLFKTKIRQHNVPHDKMAHSTFAKVAICCESFQSLAVTLLCIVITWPYFLNR